MPKFNLGANFSERQSASKLKTFQNTMVYSRRNPQLAEKVTVKAGHVSQKSKLKVIKGLAYSKTPKNSLQTVSRKPEFSKNSLVNNRITVAKKPVVNRKDLVSRGKL